MVYSKHNIGRVCAAFLAVPLLVGCQPTDEDSDQLEAVDVEPALVIGTEDDPRARQRAPELVGIMPTDFPADLPLFLPASLVNFGSRDGSVFVSLLTSAPVSKVDRELAALLQQNGWSISDIADGKRLRKGAQQVNLRLENARPGTLYHFEY